MRKTTLLFLPAFVIVGLVWAVGAKTSSKDPAKLAPKLIKVLYENDRVRVSKLTAPAGSRIPMHVAVDHAAYALKDCELLSRSADGKDENIEAEAGKVLWQDAKERALGVKGERDCSLIVFELKEPKLAR
jgi:hypothetical protein